jgi:HEAT repeat protein
MRLSAAWAIGQVGFPGSRALLSARALEDESAAVRARIAEALDGLRIRHANELVAKLSSKDKINGIRDWRLEIGDWRLEIRD